MGMFNFAKTTKNMTATEILNYYRNLYYAEPQVTERGIVANAINDILPNMVEVVRCKDCRFCRTFFPEKQIGKEARRVWYCDLYRCNRKTDEYCSDGERREEA